MTARELGRLVAYLRVSTDGQGRPGLDSAAAGTLSSPHPCPFFFALCALLGFATLNLRIASRADELVRLAIAMQVGYRAFHADVVMHLRGLAGAVAGTGGMMQPVAVFCKTFCDDFDRLERMLVTFRAHNAEAIPLALSLPEEDVDLYRARLAALRLPVFLDHELTGFHQVTGTGWTYQQVIKLCCDRTAMAENYFIVDGDFYLVRQFTHADLLDSDGAPVIFLSPHGHYRAGNQSQHF